MNIIHAAFLGLVQGLAEFLPISSSGHLVIAQNILRINDGSSYIIFDILLHIATLCSVFAFYYRDIFEIIKEFAAFVREGFKNPEKTGARRMIWLILTATAPLCVGVFAKSALEQAFSSLTLVGFSLLFTSAVLFLTDKLAAGKKDESTATYKNALFVGLCQLIALLPGVSRSGITIFGGIAAGFNRKFAVKFSLLMSVAAILGAAVSGVPDVMRGGGVGVGFIPALVGCVVAGVSGVFAIKFLVKLLSGGKFRYFGIYCAIMGLLSIGYSLFF